jgi:hypothetical protein
VARVRESSNPHLVGAVPNILNEHGESPHAS